VATFRGFAVRDAGRLDPARVRQIGFLIADKQAGGFRLEIGEIGAY
jgi:monofunctional biosynthetic peptidoglycan transglycosylase